MTLFSKFQNAAAAAQRGRRGIYENSGSATTLFKVEFKAPSFKSLSSEPFQVESVYSQRRGGGEVD